MSFSMQVSPARRAFKRMLGQANHFLITILVGLDGVKRGQVTISDDFAAAWNPKSPTDSALRSRQFALQACLAWSIDAVDSYIRILRRTPSILPVELRSTLDAQSRSLVGRVDAIVQHVKMGEDVDAAMVVAATTWRNRLVHSLSDNQLDDPTAAMLRRASDQIEADYQGLDVNAIIDSLQESNKPRPPTFKEMASIIRAQHQLVSRMDERLISSSDLDGYFLDVLRAYVKEGPQVRTANVWGKDKARVRKSLREIAKGANLILPESNSQHVVDGSAMTSHDPIVLATAAEWSVAEARGALESSDEET